MNQQLARPKRNASFLDSSLRLDGIIEILDLVREPLHYTQVIEQCRIKYKKSLLKYLHYCMEKHLVVKSNVPRRLKNTGRFCSPTKRGINVDYLTTAKGRKFLEMVQ